MLVYMRSALHALCIKSIFHKLYLWHNIVLPLWPIQHPVPNPVRMEGPAQLLTLAPVMWSGRECSVKQVGKRVSGEAISRPKYFGGTTIFFSMWMCDMHVSFCFSKHSSHNLAIAQLLCSSKCMQNGNHNQR